ncbi:MAG: hypothetical protein MUO53_09975 [Maribacter sp.]|nr:hypothetical protein [Maribacter sp.]
MKKFLMFTAVSAFMFITMNGMANEPKLVVSSDTGAKSLVFTLDSKSKETMVKFYDANDNIIFSENLSDGTYAKKFDLKSLEVGDYIFKVENELTTYLYTIDVREDGVDIVKRKENSKPVFKKVGAKVFLNLLNLDQNEVIIKVIDSEDRIVYDETISKEMIVQKAFNFETAIPDGYVIVVKDGKDTFYEAIVVN